jgi:hypothetical protein
MGITNIVVEVINICISKKNERKNKGRERERGARGIRETYTSSLKGNKRLRGNRTMGITNIIVDVINKKNKERAREQERERERERERENEEEWEGDSERREREREREREGNKGCENQGERGIKYVFFLEVKSRA